MYIVHVQVNLIMGRGRKRKKGERERGREREGGKKEGAAAYLLRNIACIC